MYKDLNHLSSAEINTLMQRYYDGEAVTKLAKEYQVSVRNSELYKLFPPEVCEDELCEYCGENLVRDRLSKASVTWGYKDSDLYCPICHHRHIIPDVDAKIALRKNGFGRNTGSSKSKLRIHKKENLWTFMVFLLNKRCS